MIVRCRRATAHAALTVAVIVLNGIIWGCEGANATHQQTATRAGKYLSEYIAKYGEPSSRVSCYKSTLPGGSEIDIVHFGWVNLGAEVIRGHGIVVGLRDGVPIFYVSHAGADSSVVESPQPGKIALKLTRLISVPVDDPLLLERLSVVGDVRTILNEINEANAAWSEANWESLTAIDGFDLPPWRDWTWRRADFSSVDLRVDDREQTYSMYIVITGSRIGADKRLVVATVSYRPESMRHAGSWYLMKIDFQEP